MDMFDEARSILCMSRMRKMTQKEIASSLGLTQSAISNKLRLLKLDENLQRKISNAGLSERHARALLRLENNDDRESLLHRMCNEHLTVRHSEALADLICSKRAPERINRAERASAVDEFTKSVEDSVKNLCSLGIDTKKSLTYHDKKLYLTIVINQE
ncbi:MAG: hypothetical protein E7676_07425 [Ruminococcaceae bacterium]|nr:hypothetical protein [Oscillospiraceae bacterium]